MKNNKNKQMAKKQKYSLEDETIEYITSIRSFLIEKFGKINKEWEGAISMLEQNFDLFLKCKKALENDGLTVRDRFGNVQKHPLIKVMQDSNIQVLKLINEFALSPKSSKKIIDTNTSDDDNSPLNQFFKNQIEIR